MSIGRTQALVLAEGMSTRAIAPAVGTSHVTVINDRKAEQMVSDLPPEESPEDEGETLAAPPNFTRAGRVSTAVSKKRRGHHGNAGVALTAMATTSITEVLP